MSYRVIDEDGKTIERHDKPRQAHRALMILSAHEIKNGRGANYRIEPPINLGPIDTLDLPPWALEALKHDGPGKGE